MSKASTKKIVTDCDGVLLRWITGFDLWMAKKGYLPVVANHAVYQAARYDMSEEEVRSFIYEFNCSPEISTLKPLRDSVLYVKKLAEEGWKFDVVSSLSPDENAQRRRRVNLYEVFGEVFDNIHCHLDFTKSKYDFLKENYGNSGYWWVEDLPHNAAAGDQAGMRSIVLDHDYNRDYNGRRAKNWEEVYKIVTS